MRGFVRKLRGIGIKVIPWLSPRMAGLGTRFRQQVKDALIEVDLDPEDRWHNEVTSRLCPQNPFTQRYVPEMAARLLREYEYDGFCVDMVDAWVLEPCTADHEHTCGSVGLAMADTFERMREAMDAVNPEAVIEFRPLYSNIRELYNASTHRAPDPGPRLCFRLRCRPQLLRIAALACAHRRGLPLRLVLVAPRRRGKVATVLSTRVFSGVLQLGTEFVNMPPEHRALVKTWLSFYHEHKEDFRYGQMRPVQNDILYSTIKVERGRKAFVSYAQYPALRVPLTPAADEIYLFNCTNDDALHTILSQVEGSFNALVHNFDLTPMAETRVRAADGSLLIDLEVPQGGLVLLTRS